MSNQQKDQLYSLVKSLTKAEKRNFSLYANRASGSNDSKKFIQLFDALDKLSDYDEKALLEKLRGIQKEHLPNLKRHLYKQILISLRLIYIQKNIDIEIREQIDFARILYGKGMYMQALKILERIKQTALDHQQDILHLEILEFEKHIEARHITRSRRVKGKMEKLLDESAKRSQITLSASLLFNFNIEVHGYYIEHGHARNAEEAAAAQAFYKEHFPDGVMRENPTFFERINLFQAKMWYAYILLDFADCRENALAWADLFAQYPRMKEKDPDLYMRGLYYVLVFLYFTRDLDRYVHYLREFEVFETSIREQLNTNSQTIAFVYLYLSKLNYYLMIGDYEGGEAVIKETLKMIPAYAPYSDEHRILLFYYKFAYFYFGLGKFSKALDYLNEVITIKHGFLREDLHHNARLLHLICHFELGNHELLTYLVPSVQRAFAQAKDVSKVQKITLNFIKKLVTISPSEQKEAFANFKPELTKFIESPYDRKALLYLDVPSWVESRLRNRPLKDIKTEKEILHLKFKAEGQ
ncbi:MAG: hypothetical protein SFU99_13615 [Saprospiraceae bacterium]|nr:hypothetical protein [Saprospiraceae bacterium]